MCTTARCPEAVVPHYTAQPCVFSDGLAQQEKVKLCLFCFKKHTVPFVRLSPSPQS